MTERDTICLSAGAAWFLGVLSIFGLYNVISGLIRYLLIVIAHHQNVINSPLVKNEEHLSVNNVRVFSYQSLSDATQNFHADRCIHKDMMGKVYIGRILDSDKMFAIRRLNRCDYQTREEFVEEIVRLFQASHPNLTRLVGYCVDDEKDRLVVYEYPGQCLNNHLHESRPKELDWSVRMKIAVGVATALHYLHYVMKPPIVHCYVEPGNVWLDEGFNPVLSSFGLVRMFPTSKDYDGCAPHMSGSYWYTFSDYQSTGQITIRADVFGFGIFLLEIITGKKGFFPTYTTEDGKMESEVDWPDLEDKEAFVSQVDPMLEGKFDKFDLFDVLKIVEDCLNKVVSARPGMSEVILRLNRLCDRAKQRHTKKTKKSMSTKAENG